MTRARFLHHLLPAAVLALASACTAEPLPLASAEQPIFGVPVLEILEAGPDGMRIEYSKMDGRVLIETRKAAPLSDELREDDPTLPAYGVDVKISDRRGNVIYVRQTGDEPFGDTESPPVESLEQLDEIREDMELARDALDAVGSAPALQQLGLAVGGVTRQLDELGDVHVSLHQLIEEGQDQPLTPEEENTIGLQPLAWQYKHKIELYSDWCCKYLGEHSATRTLALSRGKWILTEERCNHGRCPNRDNMDLECSWTSGWRKNWRPNSECATKYNDKSRSGGHNCNDDSTLQILTVRQNKHKDNYGGDCKNDDFNNFSPGCNPDDEW